MDAFSEGEGMKLTLMPLNERPDEEDECLIYNRCDGWHIAVFRDGVFCEWGDSNVEYPWPEESLLFWARLPQMMEPIIPARFQR